MQNLTPSLFEESGIDVSYKEKSFNEALLLFNTIQKTKTTEEIAKSLFIHKGTVDRWKRLNIVPDFYKNDLLRILNRFDDYDIGINASDQYYTLPKTAELCFKYLKSILNKYKIETDSYIFLEPSAGCGSFFDLLPKNQRLGVEIDPQKSPITNKTPRGIEKADFLTWQPRKNKKYIVIGNPPFGRNGKTALDFVIKSFEFSDFIGFILPPIFDSTGKGSCKNRMLKLGYILLGNKCIKGDSYILPNGNIISVKTIFQVWAKNKPKGYKEVVQKTCNNYLEIFNICIPYKPSRSPSNIDLIGKCHIYLPRTFWKSEIAKSTYDFYDIPYNDGYGMVIKKDKEKILNFIENHNWHNVVHISTNNSKSLRKDIIKNEIIKVGFYD